MIPERTTPDARHAVRDRHFAIYARNKLLAVFCQKKPRDGLVGGIIGSD